MIEIVFDNQRDVAPKIALFGATLVNKHTFLSLPKHTSETIYARERDRQRVIFKIVLFFSRVALVFALSHVALIALVCQQSRDSCAESRSRWCVLLLKEMSQAKIIKKSVISFWLLNITI